MPSDKEIEIILRLRDEVTKVLQGVQINLHKFSNAVHELGIAMRKTGREISYIGSSMAMAGTAITAPLIAAYKEAGKYNADIAHQLNQTRNVFQNLAISIGTSLLPVMRQLTGQIGLAVDWWKSLEQETRDKIIQNIFNLGKAFVTVGVSLVVIGKTISTFANALLLLRIILTPTGAIFAVIAATIGILIVNMWKYKEISDKVCNTVEIGANMIAIGWEKVAKGMAHILTLMSAMANNTALTTYWMEQGDIIQNNIDMLETRIRRVFEGKGITSNFVNNLRDQIKQGLDAYNEMMDAIKKGGTPPSESNAVSFFSGFKTGLQNASNAIERWGDFGAKVATDMVNSMNTSFGTFFNEAFTGQLRKGKEYFAEFGKSILKIFSDVLAQMVTGWMLTMMGFQNSGGKVGFGQILGWIANISGMFGGSTNIKTAAGTAHIGSISGNYLGHKGGIISPVGIIRAHSGLAMDEVPIIAQTGERILSRSQNREYERKTGRGNIYITINPTGIVKAYDWADFYAHKEEFQAIMAESIDLNKLRKVINANR